MQHVNAFRKQFHQFFTFIILCLDCIHQFQLEYSCTTYTQKLPPCLYLVKCKVYLLLLILSRPIHNIHKGSPHYTNIHICSSSTQLSFLILKV
eukprot:c20310_g1_i1 orf=562-840(-)